MTHDDHEPDDRGSRTSNDEDQKNARNHDDFTLSITKSDLQVQEPRIDQEESRVESNSGDNQNFCYNSHLDEEIRKRLDKLNALSDLINSLERKFDESNHLFSETLKQSTDRLSTLSRILGKKSIKYGRIYHATRLSLEKSQSECQSACIEFEQAVKDHLSAKEAIQIAETKLKQISIHEQEIKLEYHPKQDDLHEIEAKLNETSICSKDCDIQDDTKHISNVEICSNNAPNECIVESTPEIEHIYSDHQSVIHDAARLNDELNQAISELSLAERKRSDSRKHHLDKANKLMLDQNTLLKLERNHPISIRRSQLYFDESKRFNNQLNAVKNEIARISSDILTTKQAYAQTLCELERFSQQLHDRSKLRNIKE